MLLYPRQCLSHHELPAVNGLSRKWDTWLSLVTSYRKLYQATILLATFKGYLKLDK